MKLLGTCGGPAHLSGESLEAVYPKELRCQSQEIMLKAEFEEATRITPPPTQEPENKIKCPANCVCEVTGLLKGIGWINERFQVLLCFFFFFKFVLPSLVIQYTREQVQVMQKKKAHSYISKVFMKTRSSGP